MFDFQLWIKTFQDHRRQGQFYNDAASYGVYVKAIENPLWSVLGIHHLSPDENKGNHNVYLEMLCKQNERDGFRAIHWTWEGRRPDEAAPDTFAGQKPHNELVDIPLNLGMIVSVWTQASGIVEGLSSNHPDEESGNAIGHHSFFVCFQEIDFDDTPEDKQPVMTINKEWLDSFGIDENGFIRILL